MNNIYNGYYYVWIPVPSSPHPFYGIVQSYFYDTNINTYQVVYNSVDFFQRGAGILFLKFSSGVVSAVQDVRPAAVLKKCDQEGIAVDRLPFQLL